MGVFTSSQPACTTMPQQPITSQGATGQQLPVCYTATPQPEVAPIEQPVPSRGTTSQQPAPSCDTAPEQPVPSCSTTPQQPVMSHATTCQQPTLSLGTTTRQPPPSRGTNPPTTYSVYSVSCYNPPTTCSIWGCSCRVISEYHT